MSSLLPVEMEEIKEEKTGMRYLPIPEKTRRKSFLKNFGGRKLGASKISKAAGTVRRASVQVRSFFNDIQRLSPRYPRSRRLSETSKTNLQLPVHNSQRLRYRSHSINLGELYFSQDFQVAPLLKSTKKGVTWASELEIHRSVSFSELLLTNHGAEEAPLLVPTWSQTKTLQGLQADDLAKDVRARRGTVMQTQESSSTEPLLAEQKWSIGGVSDTKSLSRTGSKILRRDISRMVLDTGGDYRVSQKLSKHGPSYLGTLRGKDLEMAKQLSEHTRLVDKKGRNQVSFKDMEEQSAMYMKDIFTTFVDAHWYYVLIAFFASFFGLWLLFGLFYWAIAWHHNDIQAYNSPQNFTDHTSCVDQVFDFTTAFLFALEGQTTIGYGFRSTTEECPIAIILQFIQFLTAIALDSLVVTIVFTKLARPKYRAKTVEFSTKAVILERDGQLCLIVRACNLRNSLLIDVNVSGKLLKTRRSLDGEWLALEERNVEFVNSNVLFLTQPVDYVHIINEESPLYELSQDVLSSGEPLELIVIMAGIVEGTGMACQVRTSYVCSEILWGHRFEPAITRNKSINKYQVDYEKFNSIFEISPPMSPKSAEERDNEDDEVIERANIDESDESAAAGYFPDNIKTVC